MHDAQETFLRILWMGTAKQSAEYTSRCSRKLGIMVKEGRTFSNVDLSIWRPNRV